MKTPISTTCDTVYRTCRLSTQVRFENKIFKQLFEILFGLAPIEQIYQLWLTRVILDSLVWYTADSK